MLTVHARLRAEPFSRPPRWEWIARIKEWIHIPVVANGSIDSVASAQACLRMTGADGLMIGRRAAVAPWLFAEIAREVYNHPVPEPQVFLPLVYRDFVLALTRRFAPERQLGRLKEFTHYFARNFFFGHHLASRVQASGSMEVAWSAAVQFFREQDPEGSVALEERLEGTGVGFTPAGRLSG
jgi:tRNA-dihydrouridine synthase